jgi:hypothetical protein
LDFRSTARADQEQIRQLLREVFNANDDAPFLHRRHVEWKYYIDRSDSQGPRSFVISENERFVAHACAWPFTVLWTEKRISGFHPVDWVACPQARGIGTRLLREISNLTDVSFNIGGTAASRKVIINTGYKPSGELKFYARPLRPWLQARTHQRRNWKLPPRLARNWLWNVRCPLGPAAGWTAEPVPAHEMPPEVFPVSSAQVSACVRSADLFRYYEQCPIARHELHLIKQHAEPKGYFLLSLVPGQARVADAWVSSGDVRDWGGAVPASSGSSTRWKRCRGDHGSLGARNRPIRFGAGRLSAV